MHFSLTSVTSALVTLLHFHGAMSASTPSQGGNNCADPSLAEVMSRAFTAGAILHVLGPRWELENANTNIGSAYFTNFEPLFQAWSSQQPYTVPLFGFQSTTGLDVVYSIGADANSPPVIPGFVSNGIRAWVYNTPVCGSVPLMSVSLSAKSDHFWTTSTLESSRLISLGGWVDGGIIAYVLPLSTSG